MKKLDNCTLLELENVVKSYGEPSFRAKQIYDWVHKRWLSDYSGMSNISSGFKERLANDYGFTVLSEVKRATSADGSIKFLFSLEDGHFIETVLLRDADRVSGCISTQVGCRMGCTFCATASAVGFKRNLTGAEILKQVSYLSKISEELFDTSLRE